MTIENSVFNDFCSTFVDSINIFDCRLSGVHMSMEFVCSRVVVHTMPCCLTSLIDIRLAPCDVIVTLL